VLPDPAALALEPQRDAPVASRRGRERGGLYLDVLRVAVEADRVVEAGGRGDDRRCRVAHRDRFAIVAGVVGE
jgi:hypothetical protein